MKALEFNNDADPAIRTHVERLTGVIRDHGPMAVAYSGGVDSGLLAWVAHRVLGSEMVCILGISDSLAGSEERAAIEFLETHKIPFVRMETHEMENESYRANAPDRCFHCKNELFTRIEASPESKRFGRVAYGANTDDTSDHRPGARAALEHGVVAPLVDAGFDKDIVRAAARALGLSLWDKPAAPCLASRIPYYSRVTPEKLAQVDAAEAVLKDMGFAVCRVRHHGSVARIELPRDAHARALTPDTWRVIENGIIAAGFNEVQLEPDGFRSGRLNDAVRPAGS